MFSSVGLFLNYGEIGAGQGSRTGPQGVILGVCGNRHWRYDRRWGWHVLTGRRRAALVGGQGGCDRLHRGLNWRGAALVLRNGTLLLHAWLPSLLLSVWFPPVSAPPAATMPPVATALAPLSRLITLSPLTALRILRALLGGLAFAGLILGDLLAFDRGPIALGTGTIGSRIALRADQDPPRRASGCPSRLVLVSGIACRHDGSFGTVLTGRGT